MGSLDIGEMVERVKVRWIDGEMEGEVRTYKLIIDGD